MGLFNFARNIGRKVFGKEEEADQKVREVIEADNPGIADLDVKVKDGVVFLSGNATDPAAVEKAVLMAGNIEGVGEVRIDGVTAPPLSEEVEYYEIVKGDNLSKIAKKFYGDANAWQMLFAANREVIKDPDLIFPGQKIRIPRQAA